MPKRTKKLLVYLDQNFLSEMSKADTNERVRPEFREVYEILHQGFVDEKLVVPMSFLHDIESSLATHLKDRISTYQHYLGQVHLRRPDEIRNRQVDAALALFRGRAASDALRPEIAFLADPDRRVERLGIKVDSDLNVYNFRDQRRQLAAELENLRSRLLGSGGSYDLQVGTEQETQRELFLQEYARYAPSTFHERRDELVNFTNSEAFTSIPLLRIEARLFAAILTRYATRQIKSGDCTDIGALSAYAPYMDVVCTDAFMAEQLRALGIADEYEFLVFDAKTSSIQKLRAFLESYLRSAAPVNRPSITIFVAPPRALRETSFDFYRELGAASKLMGAEEYAEVYAFDDGAMPTYQLRQVSDVSVPFYGLQDVTKIDLPPGASRDDIIKRCREMCKSDHFVLIDEYMEIPNTFVVGAVMAAQSKMKLTHGFPIYTKSESDA